MGEAFFMPYIYVPSAEAGYLKLVTPWGSVHMDKGFLLQLAGTVAVLVVTLLVWWCSSVLKKQPKRKTKTRGKKEGAAAGDEDEGSDEESDEEDEEELRSALEEDIVRKGENSYYYAHKTRVVKDTSDSDALHKTMVSSYGWTDDKKVVSIYLQDDVVNGMKESQLLLKWTKTSLSMDVLETPGGNQAKSLVISPLFNDITDVKWKTRKNRLTLTLVKAEELPWKSLNGAAKKLEDHIQYDESLFD